MSSRFVSNVVLGIAGVIVVVASQAFASGPTGWIMFGVSLGALALLPLVQLDRARGRIQGALDLAVGALALWSAVASVVFTGATLTWLSFGEAIGLASLALLGLIAHEMKTERVVHSFEAIPATAVTA
jgi:hypothetical protein